jgi:hypothetical protein
MAVSIVFLIGIFSIKIGVIGMELAKDNDPQWKKMMLSGIEPSPTINPMIKEIDQLKQENKTLKELISKSEFDRKVAELSKKKIIDTINKYVAGGLLVNKGEVYYDAGMQNNISPVLLAAITIHETSDNDKNGNWKPGNSKVLRECNNVAGINWTGEKDIPHKGRYRVFKDIDDSIHNLSYILKHYYINQGRTDIASIGEKFCPLDDKDDGKWGMENKLWIPTVTKLYEQINNEI